MRILVTGGAGFLGSHLCAKLVDEGHRVFCLDNLHTGSLENIQDLERIPRFSFHFGDVCDSGRFGSFQVDRVYHLACPASPVHYQGNPVRTIKTCVQGTLGALEFCRDSGARLLIASTSEVYGDPAIHPQTEDYWGNVNPIGPRACYDEGKRCAEALAVSFARQHGVEVRIARIFNTYGPHMAVDDGRVVSNFIIQALRGDSISIYGSGEQTRSFCYVSDLIRGLMSLMESGISASPVNLGNPGEFQVRALAGKILQLAGSHSSLEFFPLPVDDPVRRRPDISLARELLGWEPAVDLDQGLRETIRYFRRMVAPDTVCIN